MKKRILPVLLAVLIALSALPVGAAAASFSDVSDPQLLKAVQTLNGLGAIASADKFNPNSTLTRAMFCAIAVPLSGTIDDISPYKNYTSFPDVKTSHWALGYINAAVKGLKLISPRSDGTFGPDEPMKYDEAVTVIVRMLGYTESDLGYNWPQNYLNKAGALGLTAGVSTTAYLTRGQGVLLFYNMINTSSKGENVSYMKKTLGIKTIENALISDVNLTGRYGVTLSDGTMYYSRDKLDVSLEDKRADITVDGNDYITELVPLKTVDNAYISKVNNTGKYGVTLSDGSFYRSRNKLDTSLEGKWADLIIDKDGYIFELTSYGRTIKNVVLMKTDSENDDGEKGITVSGTESFFVTDLSVSDSMRFKRVTISIDDDDKVVSITPATQTTKNITAAVINSAGLTDANGTTTVIPPTTAVYVDDSTTTYSAVYPSIKKDDTLTVYYKSGGSVDYVVWNNDGGDGSEVTTATALKAGAAGIRAALDVNPDGLTIIKNGVKTTADAVQPYDTLRYSGKTIYVSSLRMAMYYPGGAQTELIVGGQKLSVTPAATLQGEKFKYGDRVILCISTRGVVGAIVSGDTVQANSVGYMTSAGTVELINGFTLSVTAPSGVFSGMPVSVSANANGTLQISRMAMTAAGAYDVANATVGTRKVAEWCQYYTMSGAMVHPVDASDLPKSSIDSSRIKHVYMGAGGVEMMIIENLTGDALMYGYAEYVAATHSSSPTLTVGVDTNAGLKLQQFGKTTTKIGFNGSVANTAQNMSGAFVGVELIVSSNELRINSITRCLSYNPAAADVSDEHIMINGTTTPISDECLAAGAYYKNTGVYVAIADIPDIDFTTITVYCDKAPSLGGKVRMIELK